MRAAPPGAFNSATRAGEEASLDAMGVGRFDAGVRVGEKLAAERRLRRRGEELGRKCCVSGLVDLGLAQQAHNLLLSTMTLLFTKAVLGQPWYSYLSMH
jgi:hypothetical protein